MHTVELKTKNSKLPIKQKELEILTKQLEQQCI